MKTTKFLFAIACLLALAASCFAQDATPGATTKNAPGIRAARAAALRALKAHDVNAADLPPATTTPTTGKFVFNIKIDVNPGLPTTAKIGCSASLATADTATADAFENDGVAVATRSGSTATCSITVPYGWFLATPTKDEVGIGVVIESETGTLGTPPYQVGTSTQELILTAVPANGATTTENITTSI